MTKKESNMAGSIPQEPQENQENIPSKKTYIFRDKNLTDNFTIFSNTLLRDKSISIGGLGLLVYLLSFPKDWKIYVEFIIIERKEGEKAIYARLKELEEKGYVKRFQYRNEKGFYEPYVYQVFSTPQPIEKEDKLKKCLPHPHYRHADCRHAEKEELQSINSTKELETQRKTKESNKEKGTTPLKPPSSQDIPKNIVKKNRPNLIKVKENIWLTPEELEKLKNLTTEQNLNSLLEDMEDYQYARNKPYANHYRALLKWIRNQFKSQQRKGPDNFSDNKWEAPKADATIEL